MTGLRRWTQILGFFLGNGYLSVFSTGRIYAGSLKGACVPFLNCYACPMAVFSCPIGTLQHFMAIRALPLMLIGTLGAIGALVGRMACGWLCPFGLMQDLFYKIPGKKYEIAGAATNLKYVVLVVLVIAIPFITGAPWFSKLCPYGTLTAGIPWVIFNPRDPYTGQAPIGADDLGALFAAKLVILGGFIGLFIVTKRPFCRTVCPLGAIFALTNRISVVQLSVSPGCTGCGACKKSCPVDIEVSKNPCSGECIRCLNCTTCKNVTVEFKYLGLRQLAETKAKEIDYV